MAYMSICPSGVILPFGGYTAPEGWLMCDGSAISRTIYSNLFASIGTAHGVGDASTTFNLPDFRGVFLRGSDNMSTGSTTASRDLDRTGRTAAVSGTFTLTGNLVNASSTVTVSSTANLARGMTVTHANIPASSVIISILSATTFQIGNTAFTAVNATANITGGTLTFSKSATANYVGSYQAQATAVNTLAASTANNASLDHTHTINHDHAAFSASFNDQVRVALLDAAGGSSRYSGNNTQTSVANSVSIDVPNFTGSSGGSGTLLHTHGVSLTGGNESRPINVYVNYIIKI